MSAFEAWQQVPEQVAALVPQAFQIQQAFLKVAAQTGDLAGSFATWHRDDDVVYLYRPTKRASAVLRNNDFITIADYDRVPDARYEIAIKQAGVPGVRHVFEFGHNLLGGPTPLANGIVSGVMLGGLGYGAGALAENMFPERYVERGRLRKTLGLLGLGTGGALGLHNAYVNSKALPNTSFFKGLITPNTKPIPGAQEKVGFQQFPPQFNNGGLFAPTVHVPQFNQTTWHDAQRRMQTGNPQFTPPQFAAAATGLMSGISAAQRSPIIRPVDVIRGIASAGVGLATANAAGRALSALAGLTPAGQRKLQDIGLWGGMMHAVVPSMFNAR